jgi:transcriptional repressor NrdR
MESKVLDSRHADDRIKRRRECEECGRRFTTFEAVEHSPLVVVKKDKSREIFDREKILSSMLKACGKRPMPYPVLEQAAADIENALVSDLDKEISAARIGELVMEKLREIDDVAYVRYASVYRQFKDTESFMEELRSLLNKREYGGSDGK